MKPCNRVKAYLPNPVDTNGISLPEELNNLMEDLARNVHEVWAKNRLQEGWRYGKERDDVLKLHPCLVPYEDLPESEKEFDRNTAGETIKLILKLGFDIKPLRKF